MKRAFTALSCAAVLVALLPATISAARPTKYTDHVVEAFCEGPFDGGFAFAGASTSTKFGGGASTEVWIDPAVPFEEPPSMTGSTSTVALSEGPTEVILTATFAVFDTNEVELGDAVLVLSMAPVGDPEIIEPFVGKGNVRSTTHGTWQPLEGSATLNLPGLEITLPECFGAVTDVTVFETSPHAIVSSGKGQVMDCFWLDEGDESDESDDVVASFFAFQDAFGAFVDASLSADGLVLFGSGESTTSLSPTAMTATVQLTSEEGDPYTAVADATFTKIGRAFTSTLIFQNGRSKSTEQALAAHGTLAFPGTGYSFAMDEEHCLAHTFDSHGQSNTSSGPKPGAAPANDAPDGAIRLTSEVQAERPHREHRPRGRGTDPDLPGGPGRRDGAHRLVHRRRNR